MSQPWEIYDALLDGLPDDVVVRTAGQGPRWSRVLNSAGGVGTAWTMDCLLYTSPSPRDVEESRMPSSA